MTIYFRTTTPIIIITITLSFDLLPDFRAQGARSELSFGLLSDSYYYFCYDYEYDYEYDCDCDYDYDCDDDKDDVSYYYHYYYDYIELWLARRIFEGFLLGGSEHCSIRGQGS